MPDSPIPSVLACLDGDTMHLLGRIIVAGVWLFHGLYSKILDGIPRHRLIVARVLGPRWAGAATKLIGLLEVALGAWAFAGWQPMACAAVQTAALAAMNALEIARARDLLISALGMVCLNLGFLLLIWTCALRAAR